MSKQHFKVSKGLSIIPVDAQPVDADNGDIIYNSTANEFQKYENGAWSSFGSGGGGSTTVLSERFSGDGVTTVFNLSQDPTAEENTQIYISGVYQQKDTYSVSGTAITFSAPPPTGTNNIEVTYFTGLSIATIPDGSITTDKIANGAVTNAKLAAINYVESSAAPNFGTNSTSYVDVTNLSVTFTTSGRLLEIGLIPTSSFSSFRLIPQGLGSEANLQGSLRIFNVTSSNNIYETLVGSYFPTTSITNAVRIPPSSIRQYVTLAAGTYTVKVQMAVNVSTANILLDQVKLFVREL